MGENWFQREFMVPRRLAFNVLFYGLHFGIFAYGWWSQVRPILPSNLPPLIRFPGHQHQACRPQHSLMVRMDFPWCWTGTGIGRWPHPAPYVAQYLAYNSAQAYLALPRGRKYLVPPSSRIFHGILVDGSHYCPLRQLYQR